MCISLSTAASNTAEYVASAVGRPPVRESRIVKFNPADQRIEAAITPAPQASRQDGQVQAAYGIALDTIDESHPVDVLVVAVGHSEYRAMTPAQLKTLVRGKQPVLADVKSLYDRHAAAALGFSVFRL